MKILMCDGTACIGDTVYIPSYGCHAKLSSILPNENKAIIQTNEGQCITLSIGDLRMARKDTNDIFSLADTLRATPKKEITEKRLLTLPTDSTKRKNYPLLSGLFNYFPAALAGAANTSKLGNDKHNPGQPLHHARGKSMDHGDCIIRHLMDTENLKANLKLEGSTVTASDVLLEANQLVWRALAYSQQLHEQFGAPLAPAAKE